MAKERPLTPKQQRFVEEYLVDLNATQAAIRAGYSERNADKQGSELLGKTRVAKAISEAKDQRSEATKIDAEYVLRRLHEENEADLADIYDERTGALKPVHKWPIVWRKGLIQAVDVEEISVGEVVIGKVKKVKISDRIKRTELIGKHVDVNAFKEQVEVSGTVSIAERMRKARERANG